MEQRRNVSIGRDALGTIIATGDGNNFYVFLAGQEPDSELLRRIERRELSPEEVGSADPLPHLTLRIRGQDPDSGAWTITPLTPTRDRQADGSFLLQGPPRPWPAPWMASAEFGHHLNTFWQLTAHALRDDQERQTLQAAARALGEALGQVLLPAEIEHLRAVDRADGPPPFLVIDTEEDLILALPWELVRLGGAWPILTGRLDLARSIPAPGSPQLEPPTKAIALMVSVSAPEGSGLNYEEESYRIARALHHHAEVDINEMGELEDLVAGLAQDPPPIGVHFSGHGSRGKLWFEDAFGLGVDVEVETLVDAIHRKALRLPRLFYLGCCHGHSPPRLTLGRQGPRLEEGVTSTAARLHREGIAQVVAHFGPVYDAQATAAEEAFYRSLGQGARTRAAVRAARMAMAEPFQADSRQSQREPEGKERPEGLLAGSTPFAWAQLVLYHRGPDHPLGLPVERRYAREPEAPVRRKVDEAFSGSRSQVLHHGFIGRRRELHRLRRDLRQGVHVHVVQGLGGLGKSAFCQEALKMYRRQERVAFSLWCADVEDDTHPASALVQQFLDLAGGIFPDWTRLSAAIDQELGLVESGERLAQFLRVLLKSEIPPLVLYLDNLESLMTSPATGNPDDPELVADWKDGECRALWSALVGLAEGSDGRLALLASCRYRHQDFRHLLFSFPPLSADALFRMMGWFPSLRQLCGASLVHLVRSLAGHPRAVELLDPLIGHRLRDWQELEGELPVVADPEGEEWEWNELVKPGLPELEERLGEDLLFVALWNRVLGAVDRRLLLRLAVLRRPAPFRLLVQMGGAETTQANRALRRLIDASLLGEFRERLPEGREIPTFAVHPTVARLALEQEPGGGEDRAEGFRLAAEIWRQEVERQKHVEISFLLDCGHYLSRAGRADDAADLLWPLAESLSNESFRYRDGLELLSEIREEKLSFRNEGAIHIVIADCLMGLGALTQAAQALAQSIAAFTALAQQDPANPGWQRDLSVSHNKVGDVLLAQGKLEAALQEYRNALEIAERLAQQDPANPGWQRDLSVSHNKVGDVLLAQGDLDAALQEFRNALEISERLVESNPSNPQWQADLERIQKKLDGES